MQKVIMEIETKVISMETIKPSPPIPKSLQKHQLSLLDQRIPPFLTPWIYLYQSNPQIPNSQKSKQLKKSLSEILSVFYPVSGHVVGNLYVDCSNGGAPFFEAEASCDLSDVNPYRNHMILNKLIPYKMEDPQPFCLAVQATYFRCGGVALGILISHKIADARSVVMFTNAWAAAARNEDRGSVPTPKFDAAAHFPPMQDTSGLNDTRRILKKEEIAARIVTIPAATISLLRERYSGGSGHRPSRLEALSTYIWTQFKSATDARSDPNKTHIVCHPVDIRGRVDPPLSEHHFGNIIGSSMAMLAAEDGGAEVAKKIRDAVKAVNSGHVAEAYLPENMAKGTTVVFTCTSLSGFPLYEADFGWGRPVWVGLARFAAKNAVMFTDAASGGGIEALIHLSKQDMEKFEALRNLKSNL